MQAKEFERWIADGTVERVTLWRPNGSSTWSIYAYGAGLPPTTINHLEQTPEGSKRTWADLEAAYQFIRRAGFRQIIEIDEGCAPH